jgi:hypothetical protein
MLSPLELGLLKSEPKYTYILDILDPEGAEDSESPKTSEASKPSNGPKAGDKPKGAKISRRVIQEDLQPNSFARGLNRFVRGRNRFVRGR